MRTRALIEGDRVWVLHDHELRPGTLRRIGPFRCFVLVDSVKDQQKIEPLNVIGPWWHVWTEIDKTKGRGGDPARLRRVWRARHTEQFEKPGVVTFDRPAMLVGYLNALDKLERQKREERDELIRRIEAREGEGDDGAAL